MEKKKKTSEWGKGAKKGREQEPSRLKRLALAKEYCSNGFNQTAAIEKVYGWKNSTAHSNCGGKFAHPTVQAEIQRLLLKAEERTEFGPDQVLSLLALYAQSGAALSKYKKIDEDGKLYWDFTDASPEDLALINQLEVSEYVEGRGKYARKVRKWKIGQSDPLAALDKLARIFSMYQDNLNVAGKISLVDRINAGRKRAGKGKKDGEAPKG